MVRQDKHRARFVFDCDWPYSPEPDIVSSEIFQRRAFSGALWQWLTTMP
jgi:hypothetical protein